ncbi:hypothetical protein QBC32DRAFT_371210 [Pseudoneurospora amorphoporcata]|uniref:NACHT domain-containing protein n=1 Tax=Pseudoneurospora amorphoporcata TaxID=241081 RepID=A0AAN6NSR9_9PEZI|nr:hypothetical protein QBC32DRAFT_371210 [Pseudoneurospora amorphoporcata]
MVRAQGISLLCEPSDVKPELDGQAAGVYWPKDLVPTTLPSARVMTFGYDTKIRHFSQGQISKNTVQDHARELLEQLRDKRLPDAKGSRPLVFIAHSLGGLVVREALTLASQYQNDQASTSRYEDVFRSTVAIMFFGTPHRGADPRSFFHRILSVFALRLGVDVNAHIVDDLMPNVNNLHKQLSLDDFKTLAAQRGWIVYTFQEERISDNHVDMCRFYGLKDPEYEKVASCLQEILKEIRHSTASQIHKPSPASVTDSGDGSQEKLDLRRKLVQSLKFDRLGARSMNIEATYGDTCQWFLSKQEYIDWQKPGRHSPSSWFLWIKGKPGTGKSTLMKYLHSTRLPEGPTRIVLSFFFNARGSQLEHTTIGCYRGLLFALLDGREELWPSLDHLGSTGSDYLLEGNWTIAPLTQTLTRAIQMAHGQAIEIWIDALDECDEEEVRKMVSFFEDLADLADTGDIDLKICFSSRHYPSVISRKGVDVVLELQQNHKEDIARYIEAKLHIGTTQTEQIKTELLRKCSGIFLWVVLVVGMLNREYARGHVLALQKRLDEIPSDLHAVFEKVLSNDEGDSEEEVVLFFQLLLGATEALEPAELFVAIQRAKEPQAPLQLWNTDNPPMSPTALQRWVNSSSRGLAEVTRQKGATAYNKSFPVVQFIHESVRDYLLGKSANKESGDMVGLCIVSYDGGRPKEDISCRWSEGGGGDTRQE